MNENFKDWFSGVVDARALISINSRLRDSGNKNWRFAIVIRQKTSNILLLKAIERGLGLSTGLSFETQKDRARFEIGSQKFLQEILLPIFETYPLLADKAEKLQLLKTAMEIYIDKKLSSTDKDLKISTLLEPKEERIKENPKKISSKTFRKAWLSGLAETEARFVLEMKASKLKHGFSLAISNLDEELVKEITDFLSIKQTNNKKTSQQELYTEDTESLKKIAKIFEGEFRGMQALEFYFWAESLQKIESLSLEEMEKYENIVSVIRNFKPQNPRAKTLSEVYANLLENPAFEKGLVKRILNIPEEDKA